MKFRILTGTPLGRPRRKWEDNTSRIRIDLKEIGINTKNLVDSTQENPFQCNIEYTGSISHGISYTYNAGNWVGSAQDRNY